MLALRARTMCTAAATGRTLIGLDVGGKYVGVAVTDAHKKTAIPHSVITRNKGSLQRHFDSIQEVADLYNADGIVIREPMEADGTPGPRTIAAREYAAYLKHHLDFSSVEMFQFEYAPPPGPAISKAWLTVKKTIDRDSAAAMLQAALDAKN